MSARVLEVMRESRASSSFIPSGRQLPRTPPLRSVKKRLHFSSEDSNQEREELQQRAPLHTEADDRSPMLDVLVIKPEPEDPGAMLRGMTGYQLTQTDSEFLENMRVEKLLKKLQAVLETTSPSAEVAHIEAKSLLATLTANDIGRAAEEKRAELGRLGKMVANKSVTSLKELDIQGLMILLSDLTSELGQQEELYKALEMQIEAPDVPREEDAAAGRRSKRGAKGRAKALGETEEVRDAGKPTRSKKDGEKTDRKSGAAEEERAKRPRQESARGSRRPPGPEEQQEAPLQGKKRAAGEEEAQPPVLRRSKRIASRSSTHLQIKAKPSPRAAAQRRSPTPPKRSDTSSLQQQQQHTHQKKAGGGGGGGTVETHRAPVCRWEQLTNALIKNTESSEDIELTSDCSGRRDGQSDQFTGRSGDENRSCRNGLQKSPSCTCVIRESEPSVRSYDFTYAALSETPSQFSPTEQEVFMWLRGNVSLDPAAADSVTRGHVSKHSPATVQRSRRNVSEDYEI
ncbi:hypothetical protein EYF80_044987 [Liparis tanakae]|uniref:Uncharacterized protein n=1 Tax=Liparis tanakae TaxID=230148 RepID=A0A4Z2FWU0_9TELE|nr:hypothetical protein EYF80_044987 [Liparis tanakae]